MCSSDLTTEDVVIHTDVLTVHAEQGVVSDSFTAETETDRGPGTSFVSPSVTIDRAIDWNANVYGRGRARLEVNADGKVTNSDGVVLNNAANTLGSIYGPDETIEVTALTYDFVEQQSNFSVSPLTSATSFGGTAEVSGDALFYAQVHAELKNYSASDMRLGELNLADFRIGDSSTETEFWVDGAP